MPGYTHTTLATAKSLLAARLGDAGKVFFIDSELGFAIVEARRLWNVLTSYDRERGQFSTSDGIAFYQLASLLSNYDGDLLREQTIRDRSLVSEIEYHLIEPQNLTGWSGTDQFTFNQILTAIQRRRDQFLADTACVLSTDSDYVNGGSTGTVVYPDTVVGIRRAVFRTVSGRYYTLRKSDERSALTTNQRWAVDQTAPHSYSVSAQPRLTVQIIPPPNEDGYLEVVTINSGLMLDTTANGNTGTLLGIPTDLAWGVKYGALGDLLRDSHSLDTERAELCEQMYQLAVQVGLVMPVILTASIDGVQHNPAAISYTDMRQAGWQGRQRGNPTTVSVVGPDYVAVTGVPDNRLHTVILDVVRNSIVPTADGDYLDIGREHLDVILGMAQRICTFKLGGAELQATQPLADKFFEQAEKYSNRRSATATALQAMRRTTAQEIQVNPWERTPAIVKDQEGEVKSERNARRRPFRKG